MTDRPPAGLRAGTPDARARGASPDTPVARRAQYWSWSRGGTVRPRRRHTPFTRRRVPKRWRHRLEPPSARRPKGLPGLWTRLRRLLWSWWPWAIVAVWAAVEQRWGWAVGTGTMAFVSHLIAPREWPPAYGLDHEMPVDAPEFLDSVVGTTGAPFVAGNAVRLLNNGDEFYPAMLEAIQSARHSVTIEAYIYWDGDVGVQFAEALADRARSGVAVKILLDAIGSASIGARVLERLEAGGCHLAWFNPLRWYSLGRFNHRTHRKTVLIDGRLGFTGGAGIADHWLGRAQDPEHWRDMQIRIEGPGIVPLQTGFAQNWLETTGELITGPEFFPEPRRAGEVAVQTILSSPSAGSSAARILYYLSIVCARRSILIANPYFVPDPVAIQTLVEARKRGVTVKIMVSGVHNDSALARNNGVRLFGSLLEAGIEVYEYNRTMLHHKTMVVDGHWATIGTTNFDNRSFSFNEESNVTFSDRALVQDLERRFAEDLTACDRMCLERWRTRGISTRAAELVASFLQDQV